MSTVIVDLAAPRVEERISDCVACELVNKTTLCSSRDEPVRRFTFRAPLEARMNVDASLRQVILVHALGQKRAYSPTSEPLREDNTFDLVVRVYQDGVVSKWLDELQCGQSVQMTWPYPSPLRPDRRNPGKRVGLIAFGIGITEIYRMAVRELQESSVEQVVLLYATRVMEEQTVLRPELEKLALEHPQRFRIERTLTRDQASGALTGRVNPKMLASIFPWSDDDRDNVRFMAAGTRQMMSDVYNMLAELQYFAATYKLIRDNLPSSRK